MTVSIANKSPTQPNHTQTLIRPRLISALRTALACTIVAAATLYTPIAIRRHLKFPAFSYVTAVLILGNDTLGDALKGTILSAYATVLGLVPAMLTLYLIRPEGISPATATLAVAVSAFVVVLLDVGGVVAKRIALGQIVLVYVAAFDFRQAGHLRPVLHPLPVAASTAAGVVAAVVALVVPYPRSAWYEAREKSKLYGEISVERLRLFLNAFCADNSNCMAAYISQAKSLGCTSTKLAQKIRVLQGIMQWEEFPLKLLPFSITSPSNRLQAISTSLKGMEMALASTTSPPKITKHQNLKDYILNLQHQINTNIIESTSIKTQSNYTIYQPLQPLNDLPQTLQELPPLFFLFCIKLLFVNPPQCKAQQEETSNAKQRITKRVVVALKCSLILGLATFLGLLFSKPDGYWAVLTVAVSFGPSRQSTFRIATVRAHGTAIGSFFGVLGSLVSEDHMELRLLLLVPWIVFTTFLQRSKIYGQAGAMAAVLSAMIIMGRRGYGSPIMFTIDRLTETYIGFCCVIFVELIVQPTSASTMARERLVASLQALDECIESIKNIDELKVKERELVKRVSELKKYVDEAQLEPNLWFLPFPIACYYKLHRSLTSIGDLLLFLVHGLESLDQECCEIDEAIKGDLDKFKELVGGLVKGLVEVVKVNSLDRLEKDLKRKVGSNDIEEGKGQSPWANYWAFSGDEVERDKVVGSLLQHAKEIVERVDEDASGELRSQLVLSFATIGFCIGGLMREVKEMEKGVLDFLQWENPHRNINFFEISCKIKQVSSC